MKARVFVLLGLVFVGIAAVMWAVSGDEDDAEARRVAEEARQADRETRRQKRRARNEERRRSTRDGGDRPIEPIPPVPLRKDSAAAETPAGEPVELPDGWKEELSRIRELPGSTHFSFAGFRQFFQTPQFRPIASLTPETKGDATAHLAVRDPLGTEIPKTLKFRALYLAGGTTDDAVLEMDGQRAVIVQGDLRGTLKTSGQTFVHVTGDLVGNIEGSGQLMLEVRGSILGNVTGIAQASLRVGGDVSGTTKISSILGADIGGRISGTREWTTISGTFFWRHAATLEEIQELGKPGGPLLHLRNADLELGEHTDVEGWKKVVVGGDVWGELPDIRD